MDRAFLAFDPESGKVTPPRSIPQGRRLPLQRFDYSGLPMLLALQMAAAANMGHLLPAHPMYRVSGRSGGDRAHKRWKHARAAGRAA